MSSTERVTITLPANLLQEVDQLERNRSRFIAEAVQREIVRRRTRSSLGFGSESPSETTQFIDSELTDWTAELPDDEGLLDASLGTAVRWVEGQGWIKEPA